MFAPAHRGSSRGFELNLTAKIALAIVLIFAAALGMTTMLNYMRLEQTLRTVLIQRIEVISNETRQDLSAALDIGLRLENMENLSQILKRRLAMSDEISEISVRDCSGNLISSERSNSSHPISGEPVRTGDIFFTKNLALHDVALQDSLGQCAGNVRLAADLSDINSRLERVSSEMVRAAGIGMVAVFPILLLLVWLMNRRHRVFVSLNDDVKRAMAGQGTVANFHDKDLLTESEMEMVAMYRDIRENLLDETSPDSPPDTPPDTPSTASNEPPR